MVNISYSAHCFIRASIFHTEVIILHGGQYFIQRSSFYTWSIFHTVVIILNGGQYFIQWSLFYMVVTVFAQTGTEMMVKKKRKEKATIPAVSDRISKEPV